MLFVHPKYLHYNFKEGGEKGGGGESAYPPTLILTLFNIRDSHGRSLLRNEGLLTDMEFFWQSTDNWGCCQVDSKPHYLVTHKMFTFNNSFSKCQQLLLLCDQRSVNTQFKYIENQPNTNQMLTMQKEVHNRHPPNTHPVYEGLAMRD